MSRVYTYIHTQTHTYIYIYIYVHTYIITKYIHKYIHTHTHINLQYPPGGGHSSVLHSWVSDSGPSSCVLQSFPSPLGEGFVHDLSRL